MTENKNRNAVVFWAAGLHRGYILISEITRPVEIGTIQFWQEEVVRIVGNVEGATPVITGWQMLEA